MIIQRLAALFESACRLVYKRSPLGYKQRFFACGVQQRFFALSVLPLMIVSRVLNSRFLARAGASGARGSGKAMAAASSSVVEQVPRDIRARLGTARLILSEHDGRPSHAAISRVQASAIVDLLQRSDLVPSMRADILDVVCQMKWHGDDAKSVLDVLAPQHIAPPSLKRRRVQQNYLSILQFFTESLWEVLLSTDETSEVKLSMLVDFSLSLGLRCPTEPSMKLLTSIWIAMSEPSASLQRMTPSSKHTLFMHFKTSFDRARKLAGDPVVYIEVLPSKPLLLLQRQPLVYKQCYRDDSPVEPRGDQSIIMQLDQSYSCRNGGRCSLPSPTRATTTAAVHHVNTPDSSMIQVASMFMDRVEAMMGQQGRFMETMMGHARPQLKALSGLNTELGTRRLPLPLQSLASEVQESRRDQIGLQILQPIAGQSAEHRALAIAPPRLSIPPTGNPLVVEVQPGQNPVDPLVDQPSTASGSASASAAEDVGARTSELLTMLDERETEKQTEKAAQKAAEREAQKAEKAAIKERDALKAAEAPPLKAEVPAPQGKCWPKAKVRAAKRGVNQGCGWGRNCNPLTHNYVKCTLGVVCST